MYIGEITRESVRGRLLSLQGIWLAVGYAVSLDYQQRYMYIECYPLFRLCSSF